MAGRYIPPHLRQRTEASPAGGEQTTPSPRRASTSSTFDSNLLTMKEIHTYFWKDYEGATDSKHNTTLHASYEIPDSVSWVLLFNGANPKWESDKIIFVKSNLALLPEIKESGKGEEAESNNQENALGIDKTTTAPEFPYNPSKEGPPVDHPAIAVFEQPHRGHHSRSFRFLGWYRIARIDLLEPHSEALIRMLSKKWEITDKYGSVKHRSRDAKGWQESMSQKWAVLQMEEDKEAMGAKGEPKIERIDEDEEMIGQHGGKSVNDMLAEMRLKDAKKEEKKKIQASVKQSEPSSEEGVLLAG
ncbi:hypothetical protein K469DRAFT_156435 [Zopfia rhizophila CBS 207.26]|uniref:Uncharacterized protein n=1 Tax=Zopfia rhizophila CBS 207.26 TaxID=1314779 RepID=A0A6A6E3M5_9PEZI|nr:hypothetical protein K469DRAFT_156435 [Zopfia rhizophila CBS 207.26]